MTTPRFKSTRGSPIRYTFEQAILSGYAPDGGLWVPDCLPTITINELKKWKNKTFSEVCAIVLSKIIQDEISLKELQNITASAFSTFERQQSLHSKSPIPLVRHNDLFLLETFHGPTLAFKDIGLQVLARLVNHFLKKRGSRATILMETSGDTGPAALSAAANLNNIDMYCLYPKGRISRVQELQCTTASPLATNLKVYRAEGTTDDQAATIKEIFNDTEFVSKYNCCSMNSINVGRIATQSSYYVYTYLQVVDKIGNPINFSIPTGAFGNALGGFWAKSMGLPIHKLIIATNSNDICHRACNHGDFSPQKSVATISPAMDIQLPYNFERFLHCLLGGSSGNSNASKVLVPLLRINAKDGSRRLPPFIIEKIRSAGVVSMCINDTETLSTVNKYWTAFNYCLDPHSAIGVLAAERYHQQQQQGKQLLVPCVAVLTAHPSKFEEATMKAIGQMPPNMPERVRILDDLTKDFDTSLKGHQYNQQMGGTAIPEWMDTIKNDIQNKYNERSGGGGGGVCGAKATDILLAASENVPMLLSKLLDSLNNVPHSCSSSSSFSSIELNDHVQLVKNEIKNILNDIHHKTISIPTMNVSTIANRFFLEKNEHPDYAYMQIAGPKERGTTEKYNIIVSNRVRFGLSYQGKNLTYLGHHHDAKELYIVLDANTINNKSMAWWTDNHPRWDFRNYSFHQSNENHAMSTNNTNNNGSLFFWSWTGDLTLEVKHSTDTIQNILVGDFHTIQSKL